MEDIIYQHQQKIQDPFLQNLAQAEFKSLVDLDYYENLQKPHVIEACKYRRVSTKAQNKKDRVSLERQDKEIDDFIESQGWIVKESYVDVQSGSVMDDKRPGFDQMMEDARSGKFDVIVGWITDRIARSAAEMTYLREDLRKHGVQITTVREPVEIFDPRLVAMMPPGIQQLLQFHLDFKAQEDNLTRVKRFNLGKEGKAQRGKIPCKTPYGIDKVIWYEDGDPKNKKEEDRVNPEQAEVVRMIFNWYDKENLSFRGIARKLNDMGILAPKGGKWAYSTVTYILKNPTYMGLVRWGWRLSKSKESRARLNHGHEGIITQGQHKPIISKTQFMRVRKKIGWKRRKGGRTSASNGLLVGIATCAFCGGGLHCSKHPNSYFRNKDMDLVYFCSRYSHKREHGCNRGSRIVMNRKQLEAIVIKEIKKLAQSRTAQELYVKKIRRSTLKQLESEIKAFQKSLKAVKAKADRQKKAYDNGLTTLTAYKKEYETTDYHIRNLNEQIGQKQVEIDREDELAKASRKALLALADFDSVWDNASFNDKKNLFQKILKQVTVYKRKVEIEFVLPNQDNVIN